MRSDPNNPAALRQAIEILQRAAHAGEQGALFLIGIAYAQLDDRRSAGEYLRRARDAGDPDAARVIAEHGL